MNLFQSWIIQKKLLENLEITVKYFPPKKYKKQGTDNLKAIISIKQEQKKK